MYLLYLDDSGSVDNPQEGYLVLGGICVHEKAVHYFTDALDSLAETIRPQAPDQVEFHASVIYSGREEPWKALTKPEERRRVIKQVLSVLATSPESTTAFAQAVHKSSSGNHNPMEVAFAGLCIEFNRFLCQPEVDSYGLIILDESTHATQLYRMARGFRKLGEDRALTRIVDAPLFVSSRSFRCVQIADHVAYSVFRRYEAHDANYFDVFAHRFESRVPGIYGLGHQQLNVAEVCPCPCCFRRRVTLGEKL